MFGASGFLRVGSGQENLRCLSLAAGVFHGGVAGEIGELRLHLPDAHYLPKSLRDTIQAGCAAAHSDSQTLAATHLQVVSLGATRLDIKGAQAPPSWACLSSAGAEAL